MLDSMMLMATINIIMLISETKELLVIMWCYKKAGLMVLR